MDIRGYFKKIRDLEASVPDRFVVIVSKATVDGGREGVVTEVPRYVGCQLVVEDRARFASTEEANEYRGVFAESAEEIAPETTRKPAGTKGRS